VPLLPVPSDKPERPIEAGGRILRVEDILPPPFEWADIPAGAVTLEDASNHAGTKGGQYNVSAFAIAKYPITNEQYEVFVDANDGYRKLHWWEFSKEAKKWRKENPQPAETRFRGDDLPRTIVCWYDAVAFCQWLSHTTGQAIALPAEQQWQRAAQGDDGRKYPWGDEFDASRCNIQGSGIEEPTPVTQYPNGASPYGVMDMSGNVWEWCLTAWRTDNSDLRGNSGRVLRGGSWNVFRYFARSLNRDWFFPYTRLGDIGFRVVCASPITFRSFGDHLAVC
jgi:formylglycine-generating enzyme required for sulfatase activity